MDNFKEDLENNLENFQEEMSYDDFKNIFMSTLNSHAPERKKIVRGNQEPFVSQTLSKAIMHRSKLKNIYHEIPNELNKNNYKKQRNFCVNLLRREKKKYFNNLDVNVLQDNRTFWKKIRPLFSEKNKTSSNNIIIVENDEITTDKNGVAEKLNSFFIDSVANLDIEPFLQEEPRNFDSHDDISKIIRKYSKHPSILKIKERVIFGQKFQFNDITTEKIKKDINGLDEKKAHIENDIPTKLLIETKDIVSKYISKIYNYSKNENIFDQSLKIGTVIPVNKTTKKSTNKKDYRSVSLLPIISKLYERNMHDDIIDYVDKFLSPYLFGYRKNHSTEQCLTIMLEKWKKALDAKFIAGGILTDLSKAFDCLNHELLIAKLDAYGFEREACKFILDYLKNRKQRTKVGEGFSRWLETKWSVPQGSILGPLLFNLFINDIFFFIEESDIANYADDNTQYAVGKNLDELLKNLEKETNIVLNWFRLNEMKSNEDKCHLIVPNELHASVKLGNELILAEGSVTLLGVTIDNKLDFSEHIELLLKKGSQKLHALARISKYVSQEKLKLIMNTFVKSQFNYCPLLWMFHSRTLNNRINRLHERALRIVYQNEELSFQELLVLAGDVTVHQKNLQRLAIEMFKVKNDIAPIPFQKIFEDTNKTYNLRNQNTWVLPSMRTVHYGTETIRYRGPLIWDSLPSDLKESTTLQAFKSKIKNIRKIDCTCRLCKTFVPNLGFLT